MLNNILYKIFFIFFEENEWLFDENPAMALLCSWLLCICLLIRGHMLSFGGHEQALTLTLHNRLDLDIDYYFPCNYYLLLSISCLLRKKSNLSKIFVQRYTAAYS